MKTSFPSCRKALGCYWKKIGVLLIIKNIIEGEYKGGNTKKKNKRNITKFDINPCLIFDDSDYKFMTEMIQLYETFRKTGTPMEVEERKSFENMLSKLTYLFNKEVKYSGEE